MKSNKSFKLNLLKNLKISMYRIQKNFKIYKSNYNRFRILKQNKIILKPQKVCQKYKDMPILSLEI